MDRNAHRFGSLFQRAEELFDKLEAMKDKYLDLTAIGTRDIDKMFETNCKVAQDWDKWVSILFSNVFCYHYHF